MNSNDNLEAQGVQDKEQRPKPLKKLVKVDRNARSGEVYHGQHEAPPQEYHGKHEAPPQEYHGQHEAPPQEYHGRHEAPPHVYRGQHEAPPAYGNMPQNGQYPGGNMQGGYIPPMYEAYNEADEKEKGSWLDVVLKVMSIAVSLVIIAVMVLNLPIVWYKKNGSKERVSLITYFKRWQPLVEIEGELDKTIVDPKINEEVVPEDFNDGLDLPQIVEGQYTVLFLGFDEESFNTDVMWLCQFDIMAGKLRILQIPRDTAVPDFTSCVNTKFNSIYSMGDQNINPPIQRVFNAVYQCFGIAIDAYVTTTCFDIVDLVDCVGGIPMTLDAPIQYDGVTIVDSGDVVLDGVQAEWFIRYRAGWLEGDIGRMQNQRRFMAAAMQKMLDISKNEGKTKLYSYMKQIYDHKWIATDMSVEDLSKLIDFASNLTMEDVQVDMIPGEGSDVTKPYIGPDGREYSIYSIHLQETLDLLNKYYRPYQKPLTRNDTAIIEWITEHAVSSYDDKTVTLDEVLNSAEPARAPN